ncbi:MAG: hypothetical protein ISQ32_03670 [Rickettsiales bacterium]|nr:hypothetical protein [Rickettsiales bacterium]
MQIALLILLILTTAIAGVFAFALRKYQIKIFENEVESKKLHDEKDSVVAAKEQEIANAQDQILHIQEEMAEVQKQADEKIKQAEIESKKHDNEAVLKVQNKLDLANDQIKTIKLQLKNAETYKKQLIQTQKINEKISGFVNELSETSKIAQNKNLIQQNEIAHNKTLTLIPDVIDQSYHLAFDTILQSSKLVENQDYLIDKITTENGEEKCHYSVFIISNETVILIDNKLAIFFEENTEAFFAGNKEINQQINQIIEERILFLSNKELQENIKDIVKNLDSVYEIKEFIASIYVPSEIVFNELIKEEFNFFNKIKDLNIKPLVPASIVSIVKSAESSIMLEDSLVNYKIFQDITEDIISTSANLGKETIAEDSIENDNIANMLTPSDNISSAMNNSGSLETFEEKQEPSEKPENQETQNEAADLGLDLDNAQDENNATAENADEQDETQPENQETQNEAADLSLDLDNAQDENNTTAENADEQDETQPENQETQNEAADFDFDLDLPQDENNATAENTDEQEKAQPENQETQNEVADFDFDLDLPQDENSATTENTDEQDKAQTENEADDFDFDIDIPQDENSVTTENTDEQDKAQPENQETQNELADFDFDLDLPEDNESQTNDQNPSAPKESNGVSYSEDFDLEFPDEVAKSNNSQALELPEAQEKEASVEKPKSLSPEIDIDASYSEEMSDQNTDFKSETNANQIKEQSNNSETNVDQFDIGGFLNGDIASESESNSDETAQSSEDNDIEEFLKS